MIINLKSKTDLSSFYVIYEGSTNLEKPGWRGISHLMEHLMCKNFENLQDSFDNDGISWNAYTSNNEIVFYIKGLDKKVDKWKYKFLELLNNFNVDKEDFEKERKIVLEEYHDSFNDQVSSHYLNINRKFLNNFSPIGEENDLNNLKFMDCINFYEKQFLQPSKIINVSKKNEFKNNIIDFSSPKSKSEYKIGEYDVPLELGNDYKQKSSLIFLSPIVKEDFPEIIFINSMLSYGLQSPFYKEIRENRALVYFIQTMMDRINHVGINNFITQTSNKNADEVIEVVKNIINSPDEYITKKRFDLIKNYYNVKKQKQEILRYENVSDWLEPNNWSLYKILDDLSYDRIREVYDKHFKWDNFIISNDQKFKKDYKK